MSRVASLLFVSLILSGLGVASPAVAQQSAPAIGVDEECAPEVTATSSDNGLVILTTNPRWTGVEVSVDGEIFRTDERGCLVIELSRGLHLVSPASIEPGEYLQELDAQVRSLRPQWNRQVEVGEDPVEVLLVVEPPVCELLPNQPAPLSLAGAAAAKDSRLVIETVPRTEGVRVLVDGHEFYADEDGCLNIELPTDVYDVAVPDVYEVDDTTRFVFGRWDDIWDSSREMTLGRGDNHYALGIKIQRPISLDFFDASLEPFPAERVQSATIVNSFGQTYTISEAALEPDEAMSYDEVWLPSNRLRRVADGLRSDDNIYAFREVYVDGLNVVQSGEVDYVPSLNQTCPELASDLPQKCDAWRVRLLLFPFQVELRSFIFRQPVTADVAVYPLNAAADAEPVLSSLTSDNGVVLWSQVPRGDYEIRITGGGVSTTTPTIVTGPKVEEITVMTADILWFVIPMAILMVLTVVYFIIKPRWRLGLAAIWPLVIGFILSAPSLGAALNRPLSASVEATYTAEGAFTGINAVVRNNSAIPVEQTYCAPDFELRIPHSDGIWVATYESPDFHDVEMSRQCRLHRVDPGSSGEVFSSTPGQEWSLSGQLPPPGTYEAFIKIFDIPAGAIDIDLSQGLAPFLTFGGDRGPAPDEIPFTNPFED